GARRNFDLLDARAPWGARGRRSLSGGGPARQSRARWYLRIVLGGRRCATGEL
ncbi:MAG: hypothetical protein AVDCRST_MAG85-3109, partial [uncultured Solirubrobacteraceae bacterium]